MGWREYSEPRSSQSSRLQSVLADHDKIGPATGIAMSKSARTLVIGVQVPSQQPGNTKYCVRISRRIEQNARQYNYYRDWPPKSWNRITTAINTLWATASTRNKWNFVNQFSRCAKNKAFIIWFHSASLELVPSWSINQHRLWIRKHFLAFH